MARIQLEQLNIASPCPKSWEEMHRVGEAKRFCDHCQKHVHDLSLMHLGEAERLICESAGRGVCVRMSRDEDGRLITLDYAPPPARRARWKTWGPIAGAVAIAGVLGSVLFGGRAVANTPRTLVGALPVLTTMGKPAPRAIMGDIAAPATQPATQPAEESPDQIKMGFVAIPPATQPE